MRKWLVGVMAVVIVCSGCATRAPKQVFYQRGIAAAVDGDLERARERFLKSQARNEFQPAVELELYVDLLDEVADGSYPRENAIRFFEGIEALDQGDYCHASSLLHAADSEQSTLLTRVLLGWSFFHWGLYGTGLSSLPKVWRYGDCGIEAWDAPGEEELLQAAIDTLEDAAAEYPDAAFPYSYLATVYIVARKVDKAERACEAAVARGGECQDYELEAVEHLRTRSNRRLHLSG